MLNQLKELVLSSIFFILGLILFLIFFWPIGTLVKWIKDPMQLSKKEHSSSYKCFLNKDKKVAIK